LTELLRDRQAVAYGLTVMATRMLLETLPAELERVVGARTAAALLAHLASHAAREGFKAFMEKLQAKQLPPPEKLLEIFLRTPGEQLHPFQTLEEIQHHNSKTVMRLAGKQWTLPRIALLAGVIAGVLTAAEHPTQPLTDPRVERHLCTQANRPEYTIYPTKHDETLHITLEKLECSQQQP